MEPSGSIMETWKHRNIPFYLKSKFGSTSVTDKHSKKGDIKKTSQNNQGYMEPRTFAWTSTCTFQHGRNLWTYHM